MVASITMSESNYQHCFTYSESEIVMNPALHRKWDTLYLLGAAPPPLPVSPEDAWYYFVMNGHLHYAFLNEQFIRKDVGDLFHMNPDHFQDLPIYIPPGCKSVVHHHSM